MYIHIFLPAEKDIRIPCRIGLVSDKNIPIIIPIGVVALNTIRII